MAKGILDFAIRLENSLLIRKVKVFGEFKLPRRTVINPAHNFFSD